MKRDRERERKIEREREEGGEDQRGGMREDRGARYSLRGYSLELLERKMHFPVL